MARTLNTITVAELIELLQEQDPDAKVIFTTDYGDICHTAQALPIHGQINNLKDEDQCIAESGYSTSGFAIVTGSYDEEDADLDAEAYLVIR